MRKLLKNMLAAFTSAAIMLGSAAYLPEELFSAFTVMASAETTSGTCGENLTWTLDDEGTLTISGNGKMTDYVLNAKKQPWYSSRLLITSITLNNGVTSIAAIS